jgi:hypothetical protein
MSATDIKSMFESIKESLHVEKPASSGFRNFLRMEVGKTYLVRFVPNMGDPKSTFFHYKHHGFTSNATGQYVDATCPREFGDRCPICEARFKLYKTKDEADRNLAYMIRPHEKHLANIYVVNDPTNPENEGTVKILRFGKRIYDKIFDATEGDDVDEFGHRVYDLSENGCNFKIKVESSSEGNRKFTNYNNSRFTAPGAIPNMTPEKIKEVYDNIFDLTKILEMKSEEEMVDILNQHVFCNDDNPISVEKKEEASQAVKDAVETVNESSDDDDDLPYNFDTETKSESEPEAETEAAGSTDEKIKNLLDGLDNL